MISRAAVRAIRPRILITMPRAPGTEIGLAGGGSLNAT